MAVASVTLTGAKEIRIALARLEAKLARKIGSKALRAGAKIVQARAKSLSPIETGALKKSIKVRAGKNRKTYRSIIVASGEKWFTGKEFYAAFVEFGHRTGKRSAGTKRAQVNRTYNAAADTRKEVPGVHFVERAYEATKEAALDKVIQTLTELTTAKP